MRALYILLLFYYTVLLQWEGLTNCIIYSYRICIHHIRIILMYMIIEYIIINNYIITIVTCVCVFICIMMYHDVSKLVTQAPGSEEKYWDVGREL